MILALTMETFEIGDDEYIELYKLLKILSWVGSGGEAKLVIDQGLVTVNESVEIQKRKKIRIGDRVQYEDKGVTIA